MDTGGSVSVPGPSPEEQQIRAEQLRLLRQGRDIINQQVAQQNLLSPLLYQASGVQPQYDENGTLTGFADIPDPNAGLKASVRKGLLERTNRALSGDLPPDPAITHELDKAQQELQNSLLKSLGPDYATSDPGSRRLGDFFRTKEDILGSARRADLSITQGLNIQQQQQDEAALRNRLGNITGVNAFVGSSLPNLSNLLSGATGVEDQYLRERDLQLRAAIAEANANASGFGAIAGAVGQLGGAFIGSDTFNSLFNSNATTNKNGSGVSGTGISGSSGTNLLSSIFGNNALNFDTGYGVGGSDIYDAPAFSNNTAGSQNYGGYALVGKGVYSGIDQLFNNGDAGTNSDPIFKYPASWLGDLVDFGGDAFDTIFSF